MNTRYYLRCGLLVFSLFGLLGLAFAPPMPPHKTTRIGHRCVSRVVPGTSPFDGCRPVYPGPSCLGGCPVSGGTMNVDVCELLGIVCHEYWRAGVYRGNYHPCFPMYGSSGAGCRCDTTRTVYNSLIVYYRGC